MIRASRLVKRYPMGRVVVTALDGVDLEIRDGEAVSILGRSGSGKSTFLNLVGGLDLPTSGELVVDGQRIDEVSDRELALYRRRTIGFVFQTFNLIPGLDALGNVELPLRLASTPRADRRRRAEGLLDRVGLRDRMRHSPAELSGGEQQRVAVARALAHDPRVLLADEPTGNLDTASADGVMRVLNELHEAGKTLIVVTHDPSIARAHTNRVVTLADGRVKSDEPA